MCVVFYLGAGGSGGQEGDGEKGTVGKVGRTTGGQGRRPGQFWRPARRQGEKPGQLWRQTWRPSGCGEVLRGSVVVLRRERVSGPTPLRHPSYILAVNDHEGGAAARPPSIVLEAGGSWLAGEAQGEGPGGGCGRWSRRVQRGFGEWLQK